MWWEQTHASKSSCDISCQKLQENQKQILLDASQLSRLDRWKADLISLFISSGHKFAMGVFMLQAYIGNLCHNRIKISMKVRIFRLELSGYFIISCLIHNPFVFTAVMVLYMGKKAYDCDMIFLQSFSIIWEFDRQKQSPSFNFFCEWLCHDSRICKSKPNIQNDARSDRQCNHWEYSQASCW